MLRTVRGRFFAAFGGCIRGSRSHPATPPDSLTSMLGPSFDPLSPLPAIDQSPSPQPKPAKIGRLTPLYIAAAVAFVAFLCTPRKDDPVHPDLALVIEAYKAIGFNPSPSPRWTTFACQHAVVDGHSFVGCQRDYEHGDDWSLWLVEDGHMYAANEHAASHIRGHRHGSRTIPDAPLLLPEHPLFNHKEAMRATQCYHLDERK